MTVGIIRQVAESDKVIIIRDKSFNNPVLHFRCKVGNTDQIESVMTSSPIALNTLAYMAEHFKEVKSSGAVKFFERTK